MNYFNYFTEIEEHFQRARGTGLFLLSPVDWALIEAWKNAGIPLEAVLRAMVERHGWPVLAERIPIRCFMFDPSVKSSLTFLRKTPWARKRLEDWYVHDVLHG